MNKILPKCRYQRMPWVKETSGLSESTIRRLEKEGLFPKRRKVGARAVAWDESEVLAWCESRKEAEEVA